MNKTMLKKLAWGVGTGFLAMLIAKKVPQIGAVVK